MATKPTKAELQQYVELSAKRKELDRQSRLLETAEKSLKEKIFAWVIENAGVKRCVKLWGYLCRLATRPGRVAWKEAYVAECGAEAAADLQANVQPVQYVECELADRDES